MINLDLDHLQAADDGTGGEFTWARRLGAAMLYRAILDAAAYSLQKTRGYNYTKIDGLSGWQYVMRAGRAWPLSFESLCDHFDLDPARVRKLVRERPDEVMSRRPYRRSDLEPLTGGEHDTAPL